MRLTAAGAEFLAHARTVLQASDLASRAMRRYVSGRQLRVGLIAGALAAAELTEPILRQAQDDANDIMLDAKVLTAFGDQFRSLTEEWVDIAIVRGPLHHPDIDVVPLLLEPRAVLVSRHGELGEYDCLDLEDIRKQQTVSLAAPRSWADYWELQLESGPPRPDPNVPPARDLKEMQQAVATSQSIVATSPAVDRLAPDPETRCVVFEDAPPSVIALAFRRKDARPELERFIESALAAAEAGIESVPGGAITS